MNKIFFIIGVSLVFSGCVRYSGSTERTLLIEDNMRYLNRKCDYTDYVKVKSTKGTQVLKMLGTFKTIYSGNKYKNSNNCYGKTVVVKDLIDHSIQYYHFLGKIYMRKGTEKKRIIGKTRGEGFFLFKATDYDGSKLDPRKYIDTINMIISSSRDAVREHR